MKRIVARFWVKFRRKTTTFFERLRLHGWRLAKYNGVKKSGFWEFCSKYAPNLNEYIQITKSWRLLRSTADNFWVKFQEKRFLFEQWALLEDDKRSKGGKMKNENFFAFNWSFWTYFPLQSSIGQARRDLKHFLKFYTHFWGRLKQLLQEAISVFFLGSHFVKTTTFFERIRLLSSNGG